MNSKVESQLSQCLRHAVERVRIANAEGNPILSAWLPDAEALLGLPKGTSPIGARTVYCAALEGDTVGGVDWYPNASTRAEKHHDQKDVWFDLHVPEGASNDEITALADRAAWEKWYDAGRLECRKIARKLPGHSLEVDFISVWAEGNVKSKAKLDFISGHVFDIEMSDEGADYVTLMTENIVVGNKVMPVSKRDGDGYFLSAEHLARLTDPHSVTYESGTAVEIDFHDKAVIGFVNTDFNALNVVSASVDGTVFVFHYTEILGTVTSQVLAERYPVKGSMPLPVVHQLYQLREAEFERLSQRDMIVAADLRGLDRGVRFAIADMLFAKCDAAARHALLNDEHPHVRSSAAISQSDLQIAS
ncbi:hypothetical protein [Pandoraea terrigena]|uniref:Uncharacterized protein n=1 Tax=Pandoraea terrigena TaxID=2508292 RepID=A0A5E4XHS2_9BURK|nr:hypothetical protein [Pandoraea terrigena]VVE35698.1 hypothetical protein PTE31013_03912 [Pandoraea terrigena]